MAKSMNVQFVDGTSHTYDDVPDDVTQEQVNARASDDFPSREIAGVGEGAHPEAAPLPNPEEAVDPSTGEKVMAGLQTAVPYIKPVAEFAMQHPIGTGVVGSYIPGVNKLPVFRDIKNTREAVGNITKRGINLAENMMGNAPTSTSGMTSNNVPLGHPNNPIGGTGSVAPNTAPNAGVQNLNQGVNNMVRGGPVPPAGAPGVLPTNTPSPAANAINAGTAAEGEGWMANALRMAKQYSAPLEGMASKAAPVVKGMSKLALPLAVASELFYTSPEERAILKKAEDEKRAKGWKPVNER